MATEYIPEGQIIRDLTAKEGELVYAQNGLPYTGKYHIIRGRAFAGKDNTVYKVPVPLDQPDVNALAEIMKLYGTAMGTYNFFKSRLEALKGLKNEFVDNANNVVNTFSPPVSSVSVKTEGEGSTSKTGTHYYLQLTNTSNKTIKEISQIGYNLHKSVPTSKTVSINFDSPNVEKQIEDGDKIIPGLKTFVNL